MKALYMIYLNRSQLFLILLHTTPMNPNHRAKAVIEIMASR